MSLLEQASLVITPNAYKKSVLYSVVPNTTLGDMGVVRATTATRVNNAGLIESVGVNVPRLDYTNASCPSLLVEPQRTNILSYSQQFDNANWLKFSSTITANSIISPDGTQNADTLNGIIGAGSGVYKTFTPTNSFYTLSVFAKKGTKNWISFVDVLGVDFRAWFNLNNGTIGTVVNGTATIKDFGNGWYRCTYTSSIALTGLIYQIAIAESNNSVALTSNGNIYIYGAQLEQASYPTSYIPTVASAVTRNADVISKTGISSLIGQTEGTIFYDINLNSRAYYNYIFLGTATTYIGIVITDTVIGLEIVNSGLQAAINYTNSNKGQFKIGVAYKNNDIAFYVNGSLIGIDNTCNIPALFAIDLTYNSINSIGFNSIQLYKTRLTNETLAQLTTL